MANKMKQMDASLGSLKKFTGSPDFKEAKQSLHDFSERLGKSSPGSVQPLAKEISEFCGRLKSEKPKLYEAFRSNIVSLQERLYKLETGKDIIID